MKNLKAFIVDDDRKACDMLEMTIHNVPGLIVVGKETNSERAIAKIITAKPDILFLDIEIPNLSGIDLARKMNNIQPSLGIIYITAHEKYAIEAMKYGAAGYLLKPIDVDALYDILTRYYRSLNMTSLDKFADLNESHLLQMKFETKYGSIFINQEDITHLQADRNYTHIFTNSGDTHVVTQQLGCLEPKLDASQFLRISRSVIINLQFIQSFNRKRKLIKLRSSKEIIDIPVPIKKVKTIDLQLTEVFEK